MPKSDDLTRLKHIKEATVEAISFVEGRRRQDLETERMLSLALVRLIEIIGEAANNISVEKQDQYSEIPWRRMVGMRNRLSHAYFEVDLDIVWQVVIEDLPKILPQIETAILELEQEA
ncbi:MAG: HepT-like ribonuclease domain-containing protein [Waterburya sp.]